MSKWEPISTAPGELPLGETVDLWLDVQPSPRSMGWGDAFRVVDCYRRGPAWVHRTEKGDEKELYGPYITHWMRPPEPPSR